MKIAISLIIPTAGTRPDLLRRTLRSIAANKVSHPYEVIVVYNGTGQAGDMPVEPNYTQIREARLGLHYARNAGYQAAKGQLLAYLDDDVELNPHWIETAINSFASDQEVIGFAGGPVIPTYEAPAPNWLKWTFQKVKGGETNYFLSLINLGPKRQICRPEYVIGCNMVLPKALYRKIGGSHPDLMPINNCFSRGDGETYMAHAIADLGYKAVYHPGLRAAHYVSGNRLQKNYMYTRAYYQGFEDSYAFWRAHGEERHLVKWILFSKKLWQIFWVERHINMRVKGRGQEARAKSTFKNIVNLSYLWGFFQHSLRYLTDKHIQSWVEQKIYMDTKTI